LGQERGGDIPAKCFLLMLFATCCEMALASIVTRALLSQDGEGSADGVTVVVPIVDGDTAP